MIRDEKVRVLEAMKTVTLDDVFLGQYEGYTDDETITNKDSNCPTFAIIRCFINNPRWAGVPIIFKAGKALNERKAEMRVQFKEAPAAEALFGHKVPRNELVIKLQVTCFPFFILTYCSTFFYSQAKITTICQFF